MKNPVKTLSVCCILLLFISGCTTIGSGKNAAEKSVVKEIIKSHLIKPSTFRETCFKLMPAQTFTYSFSASADVDFNIHNHEKQGRTYVIKKDRISKLEGIVDTAKLGDGYDENRPTFCMLWKNNGDKDVKVSLDCAITNN